MTVADRALLNETVTTAAPVVVRADLENFYPARGSLTLNLTADGTLVAQRTVSVDVDGQRTVYLRAQFSTPGNYELRLNGVPVGAVIVASEPATTTGSPSATPTSTSTPTRTPTPTSAPSGSGGSTAGSGGSTPNDTDDGPASIGTTGGSGPGFGIGALLGALVILTGWSLARHGRGD